MEQLTTTPFGRRAVTAGLIARAAANQPGAKQALSQPKDIDKWQLLRDLSTARRDYGLSDRTLMVLSALLSFHPEKTLSAGDDLIVFPSNRSLSDRAHGMAESTLRRHLAKLIDAGLLLRHDSPNGKRYARRCGSGEIAHAFGFDLAPLVARACDIIHSAEEARALAAEMRLTRERIALLKRDALKLTEYALETALPCSFGCWSQMFNDLLTLQSLLRRKLSQHELTKVEAQLVDNLTRIKADLAPETEELSGSGSENGRHYQSSNKDSCESEQTDPKPSNSHKVEADPEVAAVTEKGSDAPSLLPLRVILSACPEILPYHEGPITNWHQFFETASRVRSMMGINQTAWEEALNLMGPEAAATTVACLLQRFATIRNPGGYLRSLSAKARDGKFSTAPMVMALSNTSDTQAA